MAAKVAQSAGARVLLLKAPHKRRVAHRQSPCLIILHVHMINIADEPALDQIFCVTRRGLKAVREAHHALYAALFCHLRKVIRLLARHHNGLFHRIRLSGLRRRKRHLVVYVVRRGNIHRVHIRAVDEVVVSNAPRQCRIFPARNAAPRGQCRTPRPASNRGCVQCPANARGGKYRRCRRCQLEYNS